MDLDEEGLDTNDGGTVEIIDIEDKQELELGTVEQEEASEPIVENNENTSEEEQEKAIEQDIEAICDTDETEQNEKIESQKRDYEKKKKNMKIAIISATLVVFIIGIISTFFALINMGNEKMLNNIKINQISIGELTREEALEKVTNEINLRLGEKEITAQYEEVVIKIIPSDIDFELDIQKAIDKSYKIGREKNIILSNYQIIGLLLNEKNIDCEISFNKEKLYKIIDEIIISGQLVNNSHYIEDESLIIVRGTSGVVIDKDKFEESVIRCILSDDNSFDIAVLNKEVEEINIDKIYDEVFVEPKDAYFTNDNGKFMIYTHVLGVSFDVESAKEIVKGESVEYSIPLIIKQPDVLINQIGMEAFPDVLGSYTTRYDSTSSNRSENLKIASEKINEKVILPGETFSYNQTLGKRTIENGYKEAGVYVGDRIEMGVGGGICQISSTLYNAALLANLEIVERTNHGLPVGYVQPSRDATVSYGYIDLKFKNNRTYPIRIVASSSNGIAKVEILGIKEDVEYEVVIESYVTGSYAYTTSYEYVSFLETGVERVKQKGVNGYRSVGYRILKQNGEVISKTLLSEDKYSPMRKIVQVGI